MDQVFGARIGARNERKVIQRPRPAPQPRHYRFVASRRTRLVLDQVFGARIGARNERKVLFLRGIQRERLAGKVQPGEARFGVELDGGKAWRSRLPGAWEGGYEHGVEGTKCRECRASGEGVSGAVYVGRQESGSPRNAMVGGPVVAAEITAKPKRAVKTGPGQPRHYRFVASRRTRLVLDQAFGAKGVLKWVSKIACLTRGFENAGRVQAAHSCHLCLGGSDEYPVEDISTSPCWEPTVHMQRPWSDSELPCLAGITYDQDRPESLYKIDTFHTLRIGLYRDCSASCIFLFMKWQYFGTEAMPKQLEVAHGHFILYLRSVGKTTALRSFTLALFNY